MIRYIVDGQRLLAVDKWTPVAGTAGAYTLKFTFTEDWDGLTRHAVFKSGDTEVASIINSDSECSVPWEVLQEPGWLSVGVYGAKSGVRYPTVWERQRPILPAPDDATEGTEPTDTLWQQFVDAVAEDAEKAAESKRAAAASAEAAAGSAVDAEGSAKNAAESATDAETSARRADDAANSAEYSKNIASDAEQRAEEAAQNAADSARLSEISAQDAEAAKKAAEASAEDAADSAAEAAGYANSARAVWRPAVSSEGVISWTKSDETTAPEAQNIKGAKGDPGKDGVDGKDADPALGIYGAKVGQTVQIAQVDGSGKPTQWAAVDAVEGGSGDAGVTVVTITTANGTYSADMTYAEIVEAAGAGQTVIASYTANSTEYFYTLNSITSSNIIFARIVNSSTTSAHIERFTISSADKVSSFSTNLVPTAREINGKALTADVTLTAEDVGALPEDTKIPTVPTKVSAFENDAGYLKEHQSLDGYAKKTDIPSALPNPQKLTFTGGASGTYDGSEALTINIPTSGGSGGGGGDGGGTDISLGISGAAVGKIPAVATIDSDGKPTSWEAAEMPAGVKGDKGDKGDTGAQGISVTSVKQTTTSSADSGSNVVTVTLSDGSTSTFTVKNGSKGSTGAKGDKGDTGAAGADGAAGAAGAKGDKGDTGAKGADGKSAYEYAAAQGYSSSESQFGEDLVRVTTEEYVTADEIPTALKNPNKLTFTGGVSKTYDGSAAVSVAIPTTLKNPNALTFAGAVTGTYDGSSAKTVTIPEGVPSVTGADNGKVLAVVGGKWTVTDAPGGDSEGGTIDASDWVQLAVIATTEEVTSIELDVDDSYDEYYIIDSVPNAAAGSPLYIKGGEDGATTLFTVFGGLATSSTSGYTGSRLYHIEYLSEDITALSYSGAKISTSAGNGYMGYLTGRVSVSHLTYIGNGTAAIPAGTGIMVYGVKRGGGGGGTADMFTGATAETAGTSGLVPAPAAGDNTQFLRGDGSWAEPVPSSTTEDAGKFLRVNEDGAPAWETAETAGTDGSWKTVSWDFTDAVGAAKLELPSAAIRKGFLRLRLFSEMEGTKLTVRVYADRVASSGNAGFMAQIGNFYTNAQAVRLSQVTWEPFGNGLSRTIYSEASASAANIKIAETPTEFLYVVSTDTTIPFTGTAVLEYCE